MTDLINKFISIWIIFVIILFILSIILFIINNIRKFLGKYYIRSILFNLRNRNKYDDFRVISTSVNIESEDDYDYIKVRYIGDFSNIIIRYCKNESHVIPVDGSIIRGRLVMEPIKGDKFYKLDMSNN